MDRMGPHKILGWLCRSRRGAQGSSTVLVSSWDSVNTHYLWNLSLEGTGCFWRRKTCVFCYVPDSSQKAQGQRNNNMFLHWMKSIRVLPEKSYHSKLLTWVMISNRGVRWGDRREGRGQGLKLGCLGLCLSSGTLGAVWPWTCHLASLCLNLFTCRIGIINTNVLVIMCGHVLYLQMWNA